MNNLAILWDSVKEFPERYWWEITLLVAAITLIGAGIFWLKRPAVADKVEILGATASTSPVAETSVVVDVSGEVASPGVYKLDSSLRLGDAIASAGGLTVNSDTDYIERNLNRAEKLRDGMKIFIPARGKTEAKTVNIITAEGKINLNLATVEELDKLAGVGPVTANKIIAARPFTEISDLVKKRIISQKVFDQIKEQIAAW
jgi:competence protein ComEA